jgi:transcriptional regulator with XRE-family HTH domain
LSIGLRLKEEREKLEMNQTDFGAVAGVTKRAQINYESDRRSPDANYLAAIATLGVDVQYVVTGFRSPNINRVQRTLKKTS